MKKLFLSYLIPSIIFGAVFLSCQKEYSCEGCNNKSPIAIAGPDQELILPTDSALLDGSASNDPDGKISAWTWKKIEGPASFTIFNSSVAKTKAKNLITGAYTFELTVTDDMGASAKDTIVVTVGAMSTNHPPIANAGTDQTIILPTNSITLDASGSTDPDNNITNYAWTKISGPSSFTIANANSSHTPVTNLAEGIYLIELKVTDAGGLVDRDTVLVTVMLNSQSQCPQSGLPPPCNTNCRKVVFVSDRDGNYEIYTCNADGSNVTRLTNDPAWDKQPVWSPDGTKIAFTKSNNASITGNNIYIMNADGSNVVQLTFTNDAAYPAWSPDGTKIAFTDGITIKIISSSNGSVLTQSDTYGASVQPSPAWSPDGTMIAFDSDWTAWDFVSDIFTICPNGGSRNLLTPKFGNDYDYWKPGWSPDGSKLSATIFPLTYRGGTISPASIGVMNTDGTEFKVIITDNMGTYSAVTKTSWSPDGELIAYTSWGANNTKTIKWVAANGSGASGTIITNGWDADWKH